MNVLDSLRAFLGARFEADEDLMQTVSHFFNFEKSKKCPGSRHLFTEFSPTIPGRGEFT